MLRADEMPEDNAELADIEVNFPHLATDTAAACPVPIGDVLRYLADEAPGGEALTTADLSFLRTAQVQGARYWIWRFHEPDGEEPAYVTVSVSPTGSITLGYDADYYGLTPEQFILGDYHRRF